MGNELCCATERVGRPVTARNTLGSTTGLETWIADSQWEVALGDTVPLMSPNHGGRVGLRNLGNSCFMNAGLQCLCHIEPLAVFFLSKKFVEEVAVGNPRGSRGSVAYAFADLLRELWQTDAIAHSPRQLRRTVSRLAPHLFGGRQQDVQEFLAYFIDGLHEDLNLAALRKRGPSSQPASDVRGRGPSLEGQVEDGVAAALQWLSHLRKNMSFIMDLFLGQLRSRLTCCRCGKESVVFDPFLYLPLPVTKGMKKLRDALLLFLQEEVLDESENWHCDTCGLLVEARKKIDVWKLPPVLMLYLKRFEREGGAQRFLKIETLLRTELTVDLSEFLPSTSQQKERQVYDVIGVANHSGTYGSGHYTAICRHPVDGLYYSFDDSRVNEVEPSLMVSARAYVYFLVRRSKGGRGEALRRQSSSRPCASPHVASTRSAVASVGSRCASKDTA